MLATLLEEDPDLKEHISTIRRFYSIRSLATWRVPDLSAPAVFFNASSWGPWALCLYLAGESLGTPFAPGTIPLRFQQILREHMYQLFPAAVVTSFLEAENNIMRLFLPVAHLFACGYELNAPAHETCSVTLDLVGKCTAAVEALAQPHLAKLPKSSPFQKDKEKMVRQALLGRQKRLDSTSSSSSDDEDEPKTKSKSAIRRERTEARALKKVRLEVLDKGDKGDKNKGLAAFDAKGDKGEVLSAVVRDPEVDNLFGSLGGDSSDEDPSEQQVIVEQKPDKKPQLQHFQNKAGAQGGQGGRRRQPQKGKQTNHGPKGKTGGGGKQLARFNRQPAKKKSPAPKKSTAKK